jgi:hypothetical protein
MLGLLFAAAILAAPQNVEPSIASLAKIRLDRTQIYSVRDISITRDVFSISLNRGVIAFTEAIEGKVTGAVFIGSGDILAASQDRIEKQQLFRYTRSALLSERFETAVFRFTDGTFDEILRERRRHAEESVDAGDAEQVLQWESEIRRRAVFLNERILADLIGKTNQPLFMAQIEGARLGWFDAVYDERRTEEVLLQQNTEAGRPIIWASFNKRSEIQDAAAAAHEDKSLFNVVAADASGTPIRLRLKAEGERLLDLPIPSAAVSSITLDDGSVLPLLAGSDSTAVILPAPSQRGMEVVLHIGYAPGAERGFVANLVRPSDALVPAGYRDQWIIEAFARYATALLNPEELASASQRLLAESPEGGSYESLGPVWLGFRLMQTRESPGYSEAFSAKSVWILHMLRHVLQRESGAGAFGRLVEELQKEFRSKPVSTFDLKRLAEKHAGKSLDEFFESWVFGVGVPSYTLNHKVEPAPGGFAISGNITQSGVPPTFEMPVPVYADDVYLGTVTVSSDGGEFRFVTPNRPQQVLVDPRRTLLTR